MSVLANMRDRQRIRTMGPITKRVYWFRYDRLCKDRGWHWPIRWSESAYPGSYDPPEPGFCCEVCGHVREPYRAWWWDVKRRWYEWRGLL
jgi:hypothetical protein